MVDLGRINTISPFLRPFLTSTFDKSDLPISTHESFGPLLVSLITINLLKFSPDTFSFKKESTSSLFIFKGVTD